MFIKEKMLINKKMFKYKLKVEYDGRNYFGMQKQEGLRTVQGGLEVAISKFLNKKTEIFYAGRTDKGVSATGQIIHFESEKQIETSIIKRAINYYLYQDEIAILSAESVNEDFHARFSAKSRTYIYKILNRKEKLTFQTNHFFYPYQIDIELMKRAAKFLIGKHDFSSFRSVECQAKNPVRTINYIDIFYNKNILFEDKEEIFIKISAPSFLHQMVRIIVGTLLLAGKGKIKPEEIINIIEKKNRIFAGDTVPPNGLFLVNVEY